MQQLLQSSLPKIEESGRLICDALTAGNKILICGNGGSAADAQHIAAELIGYYESQRRSWPAIALTTDTSTLDRRQQRSRLRTCFRAPGYRLSSTGRRVDCDHHEWKVEERVARSRNSKGTRLPNGCSRRRVWGSTRCVM